MSWPVLAVHEILVGDTKISQNYAQENIQVKDYEEFSRYLVGEE